MTIDWFTVIAQILNFLVLVWLLKRFLYQPILNAVDEREKKITSQLKEAEAKKTQALQERDKFQQKNAAFDIERAAKMEAVQKETATEKQRLFEEVREESKVLRQRYESSLSNEVEQVTERLKQKVQDEVFSIAQKTLEDLANASLEEKMVHVFIEKLKHLTEEEIIKFKKAFIDDKKMIIKSAFELPESSREQLNEVIDEISDKPIQILYQHAPGLVSGIAIITDRYSLSWNIDAYLDNLRNDIEQSLPHKHKENAAL